MSERDLAQKKASRAIPAPGRTSAAPVPAPQIGEAVHVLGRSADGRGPSLHRSLLLMQRRYGNRHVGQVLRQAGAIGPDSGGTEAVERAIEQARDGGQGVDHNTRNRMEAAFGADFAGVRIHTDARADRLRVQRYAEKASVPFMGTGLSPSTVEISSVSGAVIPMTEAGPGLPLILPFGGRIETATLSEDVTGGRVEFHLFQATEVNNLISNDHMWGSWDGVVPFSVTGDQVTFGAPIADSSVHGSGATMAVNAASGVTPGGGYVTFTLVVAASGSTTLGGSYGAGPITVSAPVSQTANLAGGIMRTFVVNLRTTPPRPIAGPDVSFRVGSERLSEGQEGIIASWFERLPNPVKDMVRNGRRTISISGYASTTGRRVRNRDLSERRAHVVERILRGHVGSSATLNIFFLGEDNARTPDETEDPTWRRATIVIQAPTRTAPGVPTPLPPPR